MDNMPHRIAIGSCSHPLLSQPLWKIIHARHPAAFIWGGDAVYSDRFAGLNWTAVGLHRVHNDRSQNESSSNDGGWRLTFPPPSIHLDATPDIIRSWYEEQLGVEDYRRFVEGWYAENDSKLLTRPIIWGTVDDHDYGQNNGDITFQYRRESSLAFVDFLYSGVADENNHCAQDMVGEQDVCKSSQEESTRNLNEVMEEENNPNQFKASQTKRRRKSSDPMYQRALEGKGVYGVQLFDFERKSTASSQRLEDDNILWGGGYWIPDEDAMIDPDIISRTSIDAPFDETIVKYSTTHSVAIFALDVRSNKSPWPKGNQKHGTTSAYNSNHNSSSINAPLLDFLGKDQWEWFQSALANSRATVNIIVSGLQIHPERFPNDGNVLEEWSKFPEARQMLYDMILNSGVNSPLLVSGDVHMAQFLRKDCIRSSDIMDGSSFKANPPKRPLVEITTSGMTHSWGTSFSSQPKNHRFPLKLYTYFVSPVFMTICHYICPWNDIVIRTADDVERENDEQAATHGEDNPEEIVRGGQTGKQYYLGLNFAEFEFDFEAKRDVTVRIFGKQANAPPKLEMRWTFDQLSGNTDIPGMTAKLDDFLNVEHQYPNPSNAQTEHEWICVPYRGLASIYHEYAANTIILATFCILFLFPHGTICLLLVYARRRWSQWKNVGKCTNDSTQMPNVHASGTNIS